MAQMSLAQTSLAQGHKTFKLMAILLLILLSSVKYSKAITEIRRREPQEQTGLADASSVPTDEAKANIETKFKFVPVLEWVNFFGFIKKEDVVRIANDLLAKQQALFAKDILDLEQKINKVFALSADDELKLRFLLKQIIRDDSIGS